MPLVNVLINSTTAGVGGNSKVIRGNAPPPIYLDYLVVGGGGYASSIPGQTPDNFATAGGGGGVVSGSIRFLPRFTLDVTVGSGGTGSTLTDAGASIIDTISPQGEFFVYAGGSTLGISGNPQFNPAGSNSGIYSKGGGGGSASSGSNGANENGGKGGSGSLWNLDSGSSYYAGGGGGLGIFFMPHSGNGGAGQGGGGNGASNSGAGGNGAPNTGGGGGGGTVNSNGGSGIVKMRYLSGSVMGATGGTTSVSGGYVYHTFTGSGQFVYQP